MTTRGTKRLPRGVEVLIHKAAVDEAFRAHLVAERSRAADRIGLSLEPEEAAILDNAPAAHLSAIINRTKVPRGVRAVFMGAAASAMVAALGVAEAAAEPGALVGGAEPDEPPPHTGNNYSLAGVDPLLDDQAWLKTLTAPADAGALAVVVVNENGYPLGDAYINVSGPVDAAGASDREGHYFLPSLPPGTYVLTCGRRGYETAERTGVTVRIGYVTAVTINLSYGGENLVKGIRP